MNVAVATKTNDLLHGVVSEVNAEQDIESCRKGPKPLSARVRILQALA